MRGWILGEVVLISIKAMISPLAPLAPTAANAPQRRGAAFFTTYISVYSCMRALFGRLRREVERRNPLDAAQMKILSKLTTPFTTTSLQISPTSHINTISTIHDPAKPHLLLLHGWGFGVGMWINNIDCLATRYFYGYFHGYFYG